MTESMEDHVVEVLAESFTAHRSRLHAIAQRTLGSSLSADDAVQEAWIRLQGADVDAIDNLEAWLTTVVSRICLDMLRRAARRPEAPFEELPPDAAEEDGPADEVMRLEELTLAMHVIMDSLGPLERLAVVLHDVFALPYSQIAPILDRTPAAARQLASRARARLRQVDAAAVRRRQEGVIEAFLAASRGGDFGALLRLLDPEIELRSDAAAVAAARDGLAHGAPALAPLVQGDDAVARVFAGRMHEVRPVLADGLPAAAYVRDGQRIAVYRLRLGAGGRITRIEVSGPGAIGWEAGPGQLA